MLRHRILIQLLIACLFMAALSAQSVDKTQMKTLIKNLHTDLQREQVKHDQQFQKYPPQFQKQKGLYSSDIKLNLIDKENSFLTHLFRETFSIFDNNMFVTNFVVLGLIEVADLGFISLDEESLEDAVDSLLTFKDKNQRNQTTPIYNFWSQIQVNGTWQSYPSNLEGVMDIFNDLPPFLQKLAKLIGFDPKELQSLVQAFIIPPDNDDSSINLALGSVLRSHKEKYPRMYEKWESENSNYKGLYDAVKKYAYRPLEQEHPSSQSNNASNIIDPRSYYYLHQFIEQNSEYPLSLFSTWLINQNDEIAGLVNQPFHTNNVDMTVNANSLFGLNSLLATLPEEQAHSLFANDQDLRGIHRNVTNLLAYGITSGIVLTRTDLALTYYPSEFDFYWFVARNVHLLRSAKAARDGVLPFEELEYSLTTLQDALLNIGINQLLNLTQTDNSGAIYWEGFLGNFANKTRHEDRLFSTAVTLNTFIDAYTITSSDNKSKSYIPNTPNQIKDVIEKAANFIVNNYSKQGTSYLNSFFSGSVKGMNSLPFFYPSNYGMYCNNGTHIDPSKAKMSAINNDLIIAFQGSVSSQDYQQLLNQPWFGYPTPQNFTGFNEPSDGFPFWSSKSITYIFMIQALSKYSSLN